MSVLHFCLPLLDVFGGGWLRGREGGVATEVGPFGGAGGVVGHELDALDDGVGGFELAERGEVGGGVVDVGDDGGAEEDGLLECVEAGEGCERGGVGEVGVLAVEGVVGEFEVEEKEVDKRREEVEAVGWDEAVGFEGGVEVVFAAEAQEREKEIVLQGGFAAGEGDAAAGAFVVGFVAQNRGEDFVWRDVRADDGDEVARTRGDARGAEFARGRSKAVATVGVESVDVVGTGVDARAAVVALGEVDADLRFGGNGFGVVAPVATGVATFEKNGGANAGAVVQGEALKVENNAGHFRCWFRRRWCG